MTFVVVWCHINKTQLNREELNRISVCERVPLSRLIQPFVLRTSSEAGLLLAGGAAVWSPT